MSSFLNEKLVPTVMKFVNMKGVIALKDGILYTLPLTLIGSVFLLLAQLPYQPAADFVSSKGWDGPLLQTNDSTMGIMAMVACIGIAYVYAKNEGHEPLSAGVIAFSIFILTGNLYTITEDGTKVSGVIPTTYLGGKGMITAIIIGLIVGAVYSWFMTKDIRIKMPDGVPQGVADSFSALIPAAVLITSGCIIYAGFKAFGDTTFVEVIYKVLQTPLQGMTDSIGGVILMGLLIPFFWFFGVHGATVVSGIMTPILTSNTLENGAIATSGQALTLENGAHIVTQQFLDQFMTVTGSGMTIGFVICMLFLAKSAQFKQLGKLSIVPAVFNINEPVLFGTPIVMNPIMVVPFVGMPTLSGLILYAAIYFGIVPPFSGVLVPWTTPPIISGLLVGGVRTAILQAAILALSVFVYLPFFKKCDNMSFATEQAAAAGSDSAAM
ncbi:PTS sugar transporter subunit IIC [uncultured Clostridium sp.]|uniref:PTS sugar transporter subunit IIC n=1 Tax=uncultured Clostridium sp. TaxID=59620 RepID=UPI0025CE544C|nr:PTS sugar transporter subunit IIC [uncultured Clostridium sp.]